MGPNKKLPILKLFLAPIIIGIGYGAYCYYSQQYYHRQHKIHAPIRYMQQLHKILIQTTSIEQLRKVYTLMYKHMDVFVIDPSLKNQKIIDSKLQREYQHKVQQEDDITDKQNKNNDTYNTPYNNNNNNRKYNNSSFQLTTSFRSNKQYQINYFNKRIDKKYGKFILGFWNNIYQIRIWSLHLAQPMINIAQKCIKLRQNKCQQIAKLSANHLQGGYLQEYVQCMASTAQMAANLDRQIDIVNKINKYQLVNS